jgi:Zn-dependent protease
VFVLKLFLVVLALYLLVVGRLILRLRGFRFRPPTMRYSGLDEISAGERAILDQPRAWLATQGFRHVAWLQAEEMIKVPGLRPQQPKALYINRDGCLRCTVLPAPEPWQGVPYLLRFASTLADGTEIITVNRAGPLPAPADIVVSDGYFAHDDEQLALHTGKIGGRECRAFRDFDALLGHHNLSGQRLFDWWRAHWLTGSGNDCRLRWSGTWRFFRLLLAHGKRLRQVPAPTRDLAATARDTLAAQRAVRPAPAPGRAAPPGPHGAASEAADTAPTRPDALHHAEARMLAQLIDTEAAAGGDQKAKWRNFLLTAAAFGVLGYFFFDGGLGFLAALMLVLLVHELGHYLAMRVFGYRDLSIFFLPLLGAAAAGTKDNAPPWQQLVILLAGPVPGLVLALGTLAGLALAAPDALLTLPGAADGFFFQLIVLAIVINALNLLPIVPLDGGRIAELLFFARFPRASFGFFVAGVLALLGAAVTLEEPFMGVIGVLFALSLPFQWKLAQTARTLRPHFGHCADREGALARVAEVFTVGEGKTWPSITRLNIARALLPRLLGGLPGLPTLVAGAVVYLGLLLSPVIAVVALDLGSPAMLLAGLAGAGGNQDAIRRQEERLAAASSLEEKVQANLALYHLHQLPLLGKAEAARGDAYLEAAWKLLPPDRPLAGGRAAMGVLTARVTRRFEQDPAGALALHAELRAVLEKSAGPAEVAQWLRVRDGLLLRQGAPAAARIENAREEVALWERAGAATTAGAVATTSVPAAAELHQVRSGLVFARDQLADLLLRERQTAAALALLTANANDTRPWFGDDYRYLRDHSLSRLAWAHISLGSAAEVEPLFASWSPPPAPFQEFEDDPWMTPVPEQALGWVALSAGRPADAVPIFTRLSEAAHEADPDGLNAPLLAAVDLDLMIAQQRAGQAPRAVDTQRRLREVLAAQPDADRYLGEMLALAIEEPGNLAAVRAQAHRDALRAMGVPLKRM